MLSHVVNIKNRRPNFSLIENEVVTLAAILMFIQVLDCFFTSIGIYLFGTEAEGNAIMQTLMHASDPYFSLILAKSLVILAIAFLAFQAQNLRIIKLVLAFSCVVYFFAALLPWSSIIGHYIANQI